MVTVTEASNLIGVRKQRIRELAQKGILQGEKHGNTWHLDTASVNNYARAWEAANNPNLLDATQAAEYTGVSKAVILRWARVGKLPIAATRRVISPTAGRPRFFFRREDLDTLTTNGNRYDPHQGAA